MAVALINTGGATQALTLQLSDVVCVSCARKATVVDVWGGDELGSAGPEVPVQVEGSYVAKGVLAHEAILLRLTPA